MGKVAFLFPGQGSQYVGMGQALAAEKEEVNNVFKRADERLGFSLSDVIFNGPEDTLKLTENTQPALLTMSVAVLKALEDYEITPDYVAGHSLGEYSALVSAGALSFEDAVYAVRQRGLFMEEAVPAGVGAMAAILGMEREPLEAITNEVTESGDSVQLANLNCPGQIVISGTAEGVKQASDQAKEAGAKRVIPLQVSGPFHSALMKPAAEKLSDVLTNVTIEDAKVPVVANVDAKEVTDAGLIREKLIEQVYSPVLWEDTVRRLMDLGVDTFIEVGSGNVLSGLVRKVQRRATVFAVSDRESLTKMIEKLKGEM
ncbi:ACP S-malonyltransferase [Desertibacillus haloalkaliphilus]|uniref:ACP S-malonyltransferase n=1 Tax=Desertibacillus haloalkaliphilus TaxID=1328930 RepID=UPI001C267A0B|nr:ACP S-malonyltransferase [Desertibacillus haloalkaliphilus]MBU8907048.1 ACP S-malonyltransferase [Desertibacillus haloalkaliphilus]